MTFTTQERYHRTQTNPYIGYFRSQNHLPETVEVFAKGHPWFPPRWARGHGPHAARNRRQGIRMHQVALRADPRERIECHIWKFADKQYQRFDLPIRTMWRKALKKPGISSYDLWMHEAIPHYLQAVPPPDYPSNSGGYGKTKINPGSKWPAFPGLTYYTIQLAMLEFPRKGSWGMIWSLRWQALDLYSNEVPWFEFQLNFGWDRRQKTYYHKQDYYRPTNQADIEIPFDCIPRAEVIYTDHDRDTSLYLQVSKPQPFKICYQERELWNRTIP